MHLTSTLVLIASIVCTADCSLKKVRKPSKRQVIYERTKAEGLVKYTSTHERRDSLVRKQEIVDERETHNYTLNTKHKEQDKCIVAITENPKGGLTAVPELCHLFGIPENATAEFKEYYLREVSLIEKDVTRVPTPNTIRLNEPGSAMSSLFRVMLAHSMLNYEHYVPIQPSEEFLNKYEKYPDLIQALTTTPGTHQQMTYTQNISKIAARILENGFAYGIRTHMPDGKTPIITGIPDGEVAMLREMAMNADADTIYDEMGALDALLRVFRNNNVRLLMALQQDAISRGSEIIQRLLDEDTRGRVLLETVQSFDDESGYMLRTLINTILEKAITLFADSSDDLGDRMWRYMANSGTYDGLFSVSVKVVLNHYLPISSLQDEGSIFKYIKKIDREFPTITEQIENAFVRGAEAERELAEMRLAQSRPVGQRIRDNLGSIFRRT